MHEEYVRNVRQRVRIAWKDNSCVYLDLLPVLLMLDQLIVNVDVYRTKRNFFVEESKN